MSEKESLKEAARRVAELNQRRRSSYSEPVSTEEWEIALFKLETAALGNDHDEDLDETDSDHFGV